MSETPADRIARGSAHPADLAHHDQARAEARDDLNRLREGFRGAMATTTEDAAVSAYVLGLIREWSPIAVASVAVEAIRLLEGGR